MITNVEPRTIKHLLALKKNNALRVNSEYQRGEVWDIDQQKRLIDSVLRGYPLPLIYLHMKTITVEEWKNTSFEIIDGQQRINALFSFSEDNFELFDPVKDDKKAKFAEFLKNLPCTWARKKYSDLSAEDREKFDNTKISVVYITTDEKNEARDLFIRLQAGMPLNPQEKRDAWPGDYTEFVLRHGGKPNPDNTNPKYYGHDFFQRTLKLKKDKRGKARLYCAQFAMLFFEHTANGSYIDVGTKAIDDYYYKNLDFDLSSQKVKSFEKVLDKLADLFKGQKGRRIKQQEAMHLVLFVHTLITEYVRGWESNFVSAFDQFRKETSLAKKQREGDYWLNFSMLTSTSSNAARSVKTRHEFFERKMLEFLKPVKKDDKRTLDPTEREIIYDKYNKLCAVCFEIIDSDDLDIHHVKEHYQGGETSMENAAPVHRKCHPKGDEATKQFAANWENIKIKLSMGSKSF